MLNLIYLIGIRVLPFVHAHVSVVYFQVHMYITVLCTRTYEQIINSIRKRYGKITNIRTIKKSTCAVS